MYSLVDTINLPNGHNQFILLPREYKGLSSYVLTNTWYSVFFSKSHAGACVLSLHFPDDLCH